MVSVLETRLPTKVGRGGALSRGAQERVGGRPCLFPPGAPTQMYIHEAGPGGLSDGFINTGGRCQAMSQIVVTKAAAAAPWGRHYVIAPRMRQAGARAGGAGRQPRVEGAPSGTLTASPLWAPTPGGGLTPAWLGAALRSRQRGPQGEIPSPWGPPEKTEPGLSLLRALLPPRPNPPSLRVGGEREKTNALGNFWVSSCGLHIKRMATSVWWPMLQTGIQPQKAWLHAPRIPVLELVSSKARAFSFVPHKGSL